MQYLGMLDAWQSSRRSISSTDGNPLYNVLLVEFSKATNEKACLQHCVGKVECDWMFATIHTNPTNITTSNFSASSNEPSTFSS